MTVLRTFGKRLRYLRTEAKDSQKELVDAYNESLQAQGKQISRSAISGYENDEFSPSTEFLSFVASRYSTSIDWLVTDNDVGHTPMVREGEPEYSCRSIVSVLLELYRDDPSSDQAYEDLRSALQELENENNALYKGLIKMKEREEGLIRFLDRKLNLNLSRKKDE